MATPRGTWFDGSPEVLGTLIRKLEQNLSTERFVDGVVTRMFHGESALPSGSVATASGEVRASSYLRAFEPITRENIMRAVIEGFQSMVLRKPAVKVITTGGSWKKQVASRRMSRLLTGLFSTAGLESAAPCIVVDSCNSLVAASKWAIDETGKIVCERVLPHTLIWNPASGPTPREIYQRHGVPKSTLMSRYPEFAEDIEKLPPYKPDPAYHIDTWSYYKDADLAEVDEGWRLPLGDEPGRHVMTAGSLVLCDEEWDMPCFPIVPLTYGRSYSSLAGSPLGRLVLPYQLRLDEMNRVIEAAARLCSAPKMMLPSDSGVDQVTSEIEIFRYNASGGQPHWLPGQLLPPQYYVERDKCIAQAFAMAGVSLSVATATKPAGLESGRAQREHYDIASGRQLIPAEAIERWFEQNGRVAIGLMHRAYGKKSMRIRAPNTTLLEEIDWSEVGDLKEDEIEVRCFISSAIPNTPAGRAEKLAEWVSAGVLSQKRATRWYANPDEATIEDQESATEDLCMKLIESSLHDGVYLAPETVMGSDGLMMLSDIGGKELMKALCMPEAALPPVANIELLRRLIDEANLIAKPAAPPVDVAPPPMPPMPIPGLPAPPVEAAPMLPPAPIAQA